LRAQYALEMGRERVDSLFAEVATNQDALARAVAKEAMDAAPLLESVAPRGFQANPREWGEDLTSGRQAERALDGGQAGLRKVG
jgi:hypothetical protein